MLTRLIGDLEIFERAGDLASQARVLEQIARRAIVVGLMALAVRAGRKGLEIAAGDDRMEPELWGLIAQALGWRNHFRDAAAAYGRAADRFAGANRPDRADAARLASAVMLGAVDPARARAELLALLEAGTSKRDPGALARVLIALGELDLAQGDSERAKVCCDSALAASRLAGVAPPGRLESLRGRVELAFGRAEVAEGVLASAVTRLEESPSRALGDALDAWAHALEDLGRLDSADDARARARDLWLRMGDLRRATRSELFLAATFVRRNDAEAVRHIINAVDLIGRSPSARDLVPFADELLELLPRSRVVERLREQLSAWRL